MKTNLNEITVKVTLIPETDRKHPNLLANVSITLKDDEGGYFTISGFAIWKSKFEGQPLNITVPKKPGFSYCRFEPGFWRRLKSEIIRAYGYERIPIVEEI